VNTITGIIIMKKIAIAAAAIAGFTALPAQAVTLVATNGSAAVFTQSANGAQYDFDRASTGNVGDPAGFQRIGGRVMTDSVENVAANPFGAPARNSYLYVSTGGTSVIRSIAAGITGYRAVSFYIGSIDWGNTVDVLDLGGNLLRSFTGAEMAAPASPNGDQDFPLNNRLLTFSADAGELIGGLRFTSSVDSLEADNVRFTAAVPEPATWAMMLVGFAMVGATARYRRRKSNVAFA
jgi:hypothetical protein